MRCTRWGWGLVDPTPNHLSFPPISQSNSISLLTTLLSCCCHMPVSSSSRLPPSLSTRQLSGPPLRAVKSPPLARQLLQAAQAASPRPGAYHHLLLSRPPLPSRGGWEGARAAVAQRHAFKAPLGSHCCPYPTPPSSPPPPPPRRRSAERKPRLCNCVRTYNLSQFFSAPFSLAAQLSSARDVRILRRAVRRLPSPSPIQLTKMRFLAAPPVLDRSCFPSGDWHSVGFFSRARCGRVKWGLGRERSCLLRAIGTCQVQEAVGFLFSLVRGACCFVFWRSEVGPLCFDFIHLSCLNSHLLSTFLSSHTWSTYLPLRLCLVNQKLCPCSPYSAGVYALSRYNQLVQSHLICLNSQLSATNLLSFPHGIS